MASSERVVEPNRYAILGQFQTHGGRPIYADAHHIDMPKGQLLQRLRASRRSIKDSEPCRGLEILGTQGKHVSIGVLSMGKLLGLVTHALAGLQSKTTLPCFPFQFG
jgi:hypothetical protein